MTGGWVVKFFVVALLFGAGVAHALDPGRSFHDYGIDNWNTSQGLPQTSILTIVQDREGYVWLGTQDALARFDGMRFEVFGRGNSDGVETLNTQASLCDRRGRLWFGTLKGILLREGGHFRQVPSTKPLKDVQALLEDADGTILAATAGGLFRYDGNAFVATEDTDPVYALARQGDTLWIGGVGTVTRRDPLAGERTITLHGFERTPVTRLAATPSGLWIGTPQGLFLLPPDAAAQPQPAPDAPLAHARIEHLYQDRNGNLWIATPETLWRHRADGTLERVRDEDLSPRAFIVSTLEDREGSLWFGSRTEGVFRVWDGWAVRLGESEGLKDSLIWSVTRDPQGRVVLGTNSDVVRIDPDGVHEIVSSKQVPNLSAYELEYDTAGRLWIGMRAGLALVDQGRVITPDAFKRLDHAQVNAIVPHGDAVWIGSQDGLFRWDGKDLKHFPTVSGVTEAPVRGVHIADDGTLTVSTDAGMRQLDGDELTLPSWAFPLEGHFVLAMVTLRPGLYGIATRNDGIALLSHGHLLQLDEHNGLPRNNAWSMQTLDGNLYVSNIDGVWRLPLAFLPDPATAGPDVRVEPERVLGRFTGMQHIHCCNGGGRARVAVDGSSLWYPAIHGAVRVDTRALKAPTLASTVIVEQLRHGGHRFGRGDDIRIDDGPRDVEIDFTSLSFREPHGVLFRYRMEGFDTEWQEVGSRRAAFYTNLPPGHFRFQVQAHASNAFAQFSSGATPSLAEMAFDIVPRWYERRDVQALFGALLLALAAIAPLAIRARYQARSARLEALVQERTRKLNFANEQQRRTNLALQQRNEDLSALNVKLEQAKSQLIQSEKLASIGQLAAGVAHEINNPIGYVNSNFNTLEQYAAQLIAAIEAFSQREPADGTDALRKRFDIDMLIEDLPPLIAESREGLERVAKIVRDLKDFSRIDRTDNWVRADLHRGLESTLNIVANELKFKARIVREFGELPPIECLPSELNQVFMNILMNAGQAIAEHGTILVRTGVEGGCVWVSVTDDGQGIPADVLPRIFDPFFTTKPVGSGTGLGLSISYGIVLKHHGTITVDSSPGHGTTMRIQLPVDQPHSDVRAA